MKELGVGIIGCGFIGKVHALSYINIPYYYNLPVKIKLVGVCTSREETCKKAMELGFEFATTDYHEVIARKDIDIINCCTPNDLHREILIEAMKAGKHVYCEKPLATNLKEAMEIIEVAKETNLKHQMAFEYRYIPAIMRAKQLVEEGFLGDVFQFRAFYLHSGYIDPARPITWRMQKEKSGGGALFDLGSHIIDLMRALLGEYAEVNALCETMIKERPVKEGGQATFSTGRVEVDDIALLQVRMKSGAVGTLEATRLATGANNDLKFEINGSSGAIAFNLMEPNWLYVYDVRDRGEPIGGMRGYRRIETVQRYPDAPFPGPKFEIGWMRYNIAALAAFVKSIIEDRPCSPDLYDGVKVQEVLEAAQKSAQEGRWMKL